MTLVDRSPDLAKLVEDGYDVEIRDGNLLIHHVPYVNADGHVAYCILVSELTTNGEQTVAPGRPRHGLSAVSRTTTKAISSASWPTKLLWTTAMGWSPVAVCPGNRIIRCRWITTRR